MDNHDADQNRHHHLRTRRLHRSIQSRTVTRGQPRFADSQLEVCPACYLRRDEGEQRGTQSELIIPMAGLIGWLTACA